MKLAGRKGYEQLAEATLLQGLLSGDVVAASIATRQRLQKENLRLRQRVAFARIRTERAKALILEREATRPSALTGPMLVMQLREIYGLPSEALRAQEGLPQEITVTATPLLPASTEETPRDTPNS